MAEYGGEAFWEMDGESPYRPDQQAIARDRLQASRLDAWPSFDFASCRQVDRDEYVNIRRIVLPLISSS